VGGKQCYEREGSQARVYEFIGIKWHWPDRRGRKERKKGDKQRISERTKGMSREEVSTTRAWDG
jgi:hypothetical protein